MTTLRYISACGAMLFSAAVASLVTMDVVSNGSASAEDVARLASAEPASQAAPATPTRQVRIIDLSAASAASSDQTKWHNRSRKPPIQKTTARAGAGPGDARAIEKSKKKIVRRTAPPAQDARAAYAADPTQRRGGFGLFDW
jgi:hypothetical protein